MAGKKIDRKKAIIVGAVWSVAYFTFILYYVSNNLGFNLLSPKDWEATYIAFTAGQFAIGPGKSVLLVLTLILLVPIWLIGWKAFYSINWKVPRFLLRHKETRFKRELIIAPNKGKLQAPVKLRLQSANSYSSLKKEDFGQLPELPIPSQDSRHIVSVVEKTTTSTDVQDIIAYASQYGVDTFKDVVLDGIKIPLAVSTDDKAVLITLLDTPEATWIVDITDEESEWYSETSHIPSPTAFIKKAADALQALEPDSLVIPAVVITDGKIYDATDIANHYEAMGIQILRFKNGAPASLKTLESFIDAHFAAQSDTIPEQEHYDNAFDTNETDDVLNEPYSAQTQNEEIDDYVEPELQTSDDTVYEDDSFDNTFFEGDSVKETPVEDDINENDIESENIIENGSDENIHPRNNPIKEPETVETKEQADKDYFPDMMFQNHADDDAFVLTKELQLPEDGTEI